MNQAATRNVERSRRMHYANNRKLAETNCDELEPRRRKMALTTTDNEPVQAWRNDNDVLGFAMLRESTQERVEERRT